MVFAFLSAPIDTPPFLGSLAGNHLCGRDDEGNGTYTAEGIIKLCEGLKGSAVTSLRCAAAPECSRLCQRPLTQLTTHLRTPPPQSRGQRARSRRRSRSRGGSQGQLDAAIAQVSRLALSNQLSGVCLGVSAR